MEIMIKICSAIGTLLMIFKLYQYLYYIGIFKSQKFPSAKVFHNYAICIPARNEEKVIINLLESIVNQDYPHKRLTVFVVADNCTDNTSQKVKEFAKNCDVNIVCYEHNNKNERTKGFALRYLFNKIKDDYTIENFDAYFIFDSDNVLAGDYITRMNEAFDAGNKIVTSFRNSKNVYQNWISFSYAQHWLRTCLYEHRGKSVLNLACRIQGTGFMFSNELVKNGWNYTSLTEDRAFCSDAVVQGYNITYCEAAKFYDEQPYKLKIALRQRVRWAKGHLQSSVENCPKLLKNSCKLDKNTAKSIDCFWLNFPGSIESAVRKLITWTCQIIIGIQASRVLGVLAGISLSILSGLAMSWLGNMGFTLFCCIYYHKQLPKTNFFKFIYLIFMSPLFYKIGEYCSYIALFKKVDWKPIPHDYTVDIKKLK